METHTLFLVINLCVMALFISKANTSFLSKGNPYVKNCDSNDECPNGTSCLLPGAVKANPSAQKKCYPCNCTEQSQCYFSHHMMYCDCAGNGFTGVNCELNIDDCCPMQCLNGATCVDGINEYSCICAPGYSGTNCEIDIDECMNDPCMNGGTCNDGVNEYMCTCAPGFTGNDCQINIDDCSTSPCLNDATCNDGIDGYTCTCAPGYTGYHCGIDIVECYPMPCLNGATCNDGINTFSCTCAPGYTGTNCEIDINECIPNQCGNGLCTDGINQYTCTCDPGYTGINCETDINECIPNQCEYGLCTDGINQYTCTCDPGYTGINCETAQLYTCTEQGCQNAIQCKCTPGYTGPTCEINDTPLYAYSTPNTFTSPGHPCRYFHNQNMRWKIIAPPCKRVKFWINDFSIDEGYDFFYVHDGDCDGTPTTCSNLGVYTGNTLDFFYHDYAHTYFNYRADLDADLSVPFITSLAVATLTFKSDGIISGYGFSIVYMYID